MSPPPPDAPVRLRLKCPDAEDFVQRFAPNVTRGGIFLPTQEARVVGAAIRFEIALVDDSVVFAGEGEVTWVKPKGMGVKFTTLDPATAPMLERLLARREASGPAASAPDHRQSRSPWPLQRATSREAASTDPSVARRRAKARAPQQIRLRPRGSPRPPTMPTTRLASRPMRRRYRRSRAWRSPAIGRRYERGGKGRGRSRGPRG